MPRPERWAKWGTHHRPKYENVGGRWVRVVGRTKDLDERARELVKAHGRGPFAVVKQNIAGVVLETKRGGAEYVIAGKFTRETKQPQGKKWTRRDKN